MPANQPCASSASNRHRARLHLRANFFDQDVKRVTHSERLYCTGSFLTSQSALVHEQDPLRRVGQVGEDVARILRAVRVELEHRPRGLVRVRVRVRARARVRVRVRVS